jgi:hypothetical protein
VIVSPRHAAEVCHLLIGRERQQRLAERAGMGRYHDADLWHLSSSVGSRLVDDHHDLVEQQHRGPDRTTDAPRQALRPDGDA